jgi:secondary thiamine-phosphate synthase enzyme
VSSLRQQKRTSQRHALHVAAASVQADAPPASTEWFQKTIRLPSVKRGCHVMTHEVADQLPEIGEFEVGMANFFLLHTSASLTINENASPDVPLDLNDALDKIAPEGGHYRHLDEGYDDMPAHVKSSLMGASLDVPISRGRLALGTWQGIYLNEHRNHGGARQLVVTIQGRKRADGQKYGRFR